MKQSEINKLERMVEKEIDKWEDGPIELSNEENSAWYSGRSYGMRELFKALKPHLLVSGEEKEKLSSKHNATIFFRDADKWKTLYEDLQSKLSSTTARMEAAEKVIEVMFRSDDSFDKALGVWQSLKSQHETVVEEKSFK